MLFLLTDSPQKVKLEKIHDTLILFYVSPSSPQLQRLFFYQKYKKTTTLQQVTGGNPPNLVLQRMLRYFLKIPPLKKIFTISRQNLLSLLKTPKNNHFSASEWWGNTKSSFKKNVRTSSKIAPFKKILKF